ncbi:MAG: ABC transporter ATP-binding protein/permease, partial [Planctomycetota bacterium]|nr:ABC transporter ATP-binding protein/permease [Planctomycetota bacterium]
TMYLPAKKLSRDYNTIQESLAGCERIFAMLDEKPEVEDAPTAEEVKEMRGEIVFEDVWFTYNSGEPALKGISFTVKPGESLAIVGASGSGKSTILNLILRFYDPQKGRILIDGIDIKQIKRRSLLRHLAVVTQEPFLFNTTVLENIGYGRVGATREDIISSAKAAKIHDVITALPQGYDTVVGERGGNLSGGERQRVTIARAILRNPTILLLDEATSNLDSESEKAVQEALAELMKNRTTIMVAHRLSSISGVDRIIVIEDGKIVEEGSHEELMAAGGIYRKMFDLQHYTEEAEARAE